MLPDLNCQLRDFDDDVDIFSQMISPVHTGSPSFTLLIKSSTTCVALHKTFHCETKTTQEKIDEIKDQGYDVKQMWECEWERLKKQDPELKAFVKDMQRPCDRYSTMREDSILQTIMDEKLFGALAVDLHVPDDLKSKFAEMPPVFKNIDISRDDIGDHMKAYAEEKGIMTRKEHV